MKEKSILTVFWAIQSIICLGQLQVNWSRTFFADEENYYRNYPKLKMDNNQDLIVVGGSYIIKYDTSGNELWWNEFEGEAFYSDPGDGHDHFVIDEGNNIYVLSNRVAYTNNYDTTINVVNTRKYSPAGQEVWESEYRYYSQYTQDSGASLAINGNHVYITGQSRDSITYCDLFLVCYDIETGDEKWRTTHHDTGNDCDRGNRIRMDQNGDIIIGGKSTTSQNNEYFLLKYDTSGNLQWVSRYENLAFIVNLFADMAITSDNNIVMTGHFYSTVSFSNDGTQLWNYAPPSNLPPNVGADRAKDIVALNNGDVIITGYHTDYIGSTIDSDVLTLRINSAGEVIWSARYDTENIIKKHDHGNAISVDGNGDILIAGQSEMEQDNGYNNDFLIIKYDGDTGEMLWDFIDDQNPFEDDIIYSIYSSEDQSIYVAGMGYENGKFQFITKRYNEQTVSAKDLRKQNPEFTISPNPANGSAFRIDSNLNVENSFTIKIFDLLGNMLFESTDYSLGQEITLNGLIDGIYFIQINGNGLMATIKLLSKE